MLIDTHVHVGAFYNLYYTPLFVAKVMRDLGVCNYVVSSTTTCERDYEKATAEIKLLLDIDSSKIFPCLWLTEEHFSFIQNNSLGNQIKWSCLKIHAGLSQGEWNPNKKITIKLLEYADNHRLPLLIHTGYDNWCCASLYKNLIAQFPKVKIILAHGRPLDETIEMVAKYENAYTDTAFMEVSDIVKFVREGLSHKVLWGSDFPIFPKQIKKEFEIDEYQNKLHSLKKICSQSEFDRITFKNAQTVFSVI